MSGLRLCRGFALAAALVLGGTAMAQQAADNEHAGHDAANSATDAAAARGTRAAAPADAPRTPIPALTDADRAAAVPSPGGHAAHDNSIHAYLLLDQLELWQEEGQLAQGWEAEGWMGTDINRLLLRTQGKREDGRTEEADVQLLYGRSITAWWDLVAGLRQDIRPRQARTFAAFGIQGTAPYDIEVNLTGYLGEGGRTAARFEAHYEMRFTGRLILQWQLETDVYGKNDAQRGLGSGLSSLQAGARLRYEFTRRFAPYLGVNHERALGGTADLRQDAGAGTNDTSLVFGLRTWF